MTGMATNTRIRLSAMMFIQFMLFAVWWVPLAAYLTNTGVTGYQRAMILSSMALGSLTAPLVGMFADRHVNGERLLFILNLVCGGLLLLAARTSSPGALFWLLLLAMFCYMPTWGLTSAIAMSHSPAESFPQIRVFGSIGWVASGICSLVAVKVLGVEKFDGTALPMYCGAGLSVVGAFCALALPGTPPPARGKPASIVDALGLRSFALMRDANFAIFILLSLLVMIPFAIYWSYFSMYLEAKGFKLLTFTMNFGQFAEMFFMLLVTVALRRVGVKWAMFAGLVALTARYFSFWVSSALPSLAALVYVGILVHGIIFGFFFVGGQIYINRVAPPEMKAQAQGFLSLTSFGVGLLVGNLANEWLIGRCTAGGMTDWSRVWLITTIFSAALTVLFAGLFRYREPAAPTPAS